VVARAQQRGQARDLEAIAAELLVELKGTMQVSGPGAKG
jgi:hypothetical protein